MQQFENGQRIGFETLLHTEITLGTTAVGLPALPEARLVKRTVIRNLDQPITWTDVSGDTPTDTHGMVNLADEVLVYDGDVADFKFRRAATATADADVRITYLG